MAILLILSFLATSVSWALPPLQAPGLTGNYKLSYIDSDLEIAYRGNKSKGAKSKSFDFNKVATPPVPSPIYLFHNPKDPSATIIGGGSDSPRYCQGESDLLSQHLDCSALSKNFFKDEKTQCGIRSIFIEAIMFSIGEGLRYGRMEQFIFEKDTETECQEYKKKLSQELEAGTAPDFFKAMKAAGLIKELSDIPDGFYLTHLYKLEETKDEVTELPKGNETGAYNLAYSGRSQSLSWLGEERAELVESEVFDAKSIPITVERLDTILLFIYPEKNQVKISGGGQSKMRTCENTSKEDDKTKVFSCQLFKANEEELGTGCSIQHLLKEEVTLVPGEAPKYQRVEQRTLLAETKEGCENYRKKVAQELSEDSAELFFRVLFKTGGVKNLEKLGDTFQLIHEYSLSPVN